MYRYAFTLDVQNIEYDAGPVNRYIYYWSDTLTVYNLIHSLTQINIKLWYSRPNAPNWQEYLLLLSLCALCSFFQFYCPSYPCWLTPTLMTPWFLKWRRCIKWTEKSITRQRKNGQWNMLEAIDVCQVQELILVLSEVKDSILSRAVTKNIFEDGILNESTHTFHSLSVNSWLNDVLAFAVWKESVVIWRNFQIL